MDTTAERIIQEIILTDHAIDKAFMADDAALEAEAMARRSGLLGDLARNLGISEAEAEAKVMSERENR